MVVHRKRRQHFSRNGTRRKYRGKSDRFQVFEPFHSIAGVQLLWDRKYGEKYAGSRRTRRRRRRSRRKRRQRRRKWRRKRGGGKEEKEENPVKKHVSAGGQLAANPD